MDKKIMNVSPNALKNGFAHNRERKYGSLGSSIMQGQYSRQTGAVLITAIVLMIIFTLLGVAAMRANITDVSIQSSLRNRANAFQCAEAGLRAGEIWLSKLSEPAYQVPANPVQNENQVWEVNQDVIKNPELGKEALWADPLKTWAYGNVMTHGTASVGCGTEPRYFIEALGSLLPDSENLDYKIQARGRGVMYRITAYSTGIDNTAAVVLQTTYLQPIN